MENTLQIQDQQSTVYRRSNHFSPLQSMRIQGAFCDVIIKAGHAKFNAHRIVLAATTRYFRKMFINDFKEQNNKIISIKDISATNMEAFITFAYTGQITLTKDNVRSLMKDADYLDLIDIKEECMKFLNSYIHVQNVCDVYHLAEILSCKPLMEDSKKFIQQHFRDVSLTNDYLYVDFGFLKDVLSSDNLHASSQITIFESVMKWIFNNVNERKIYLPELLGLIKFYDISSEYLIGYFFKNNLLATNCKHSKLVSEILLAYKIQKNSSRYDKKYIFVIDETNSNIISIYNYLLGTWDIITASNGCNTDFSVTVYKEKIYKFGGKVDGRESTSAQVYEPQNKVWKRITPMDFRRCKCAGSSLNDFLYICGGWINERPSNVVEQYCDESNEWKTMSPMNCRRSHLAVVTFHGYIYAIGGYDNVSSLSSVERYDPQNNQWTTLNSAMKQKRWGCGAAVLNGKLYVCGGCNKNAKSVEVYDPETNKWEYVASMNDARWDVLIVAYMGKLWAIGGFDGMNVLSTVEMYDPNTDIWSYAKPINKVKGTFVGCVMSC